MDKLGSKHVMLFSVFLLAACGDTAGNWPNLADPLPDASGRARVVDRGQPVAPKNTREKQDIAPMTKSLAFKLVTAVAAEAKKATEAYLTVKHTIETVTSEEKPTAWREAQLMLTRLSKTTARLDSILYSENMKHENIWADASRLQVTQDSYVASERQLLAKIKPE